MLTPLLIALAVGYVLGSLPFGYLVARARGVNIFEVGSKSPGATNVRRVLGRGPGNLVFLLDLLKGAVATSLPAFYLAWARNAGSVHTETAHAFSSLAEQAYLPIAGLVGALLGHSFSCFTGFRGGKGVATATGGLVVMIPISVGIAALVWVATFFASRYVSLASILASIALPISVFVLGGRSVILGLAITVAAFVVLRHRANIQRLMNGTENKFAKKEAKP